MKYALERIIIAKVVKLRLSYFFRLAKPPDKTLLPDLITYSLNQRHNEWTTARSQLNVIKELNAIMYIPKLWDKKIICSSDA